jgi:hypothetical protein
MATCVACDSELPRYQTTGRCMHCAEMASYRCSECDKGLAYGEAEFRRVYGGSEAAFCQDSGSCQVLPLAPRMREAARAGAAEDMISALRASRATMLRARALLLSDRCAEAKQIAATVAQIDSALLKAGEL